MIIFRHFLADDSKQIIRKSFNFEIIKNVIVTLV